MRLHLRTATLVWVVASLAAAIAIVALVASAADARIIPKPVSAVAHNSTVLDLGTFDPEATGGVTVPLFGRSLDTYKGGTSYSVAGPGLAGDFAPLTAPMNESADFPTELNGLSGLFRTPGSQQLSTSVAWRKCLHSVDFGTPRCADQGSGGTDTAIVSANVAPTPLHASPDGGLRTADVQTPSLHFHGLVGVSFSMPAGTNDTAYETVFWGDGTSTRYCRSHNPATGCDPTVVPDHVYSAYGDYTVIDEVGYSNGTVTASVVRGAAATFHLLQPGTLVGTPLAATEGQAFSGRVATISSAACPGCTYTADIDWGDGVHSAGTLTANGSGYLVKGSHLFAEEGTYQVVVRVTTSLGATSSQTSVTDTATVADAPLVASTGNQLYVSGPFLGMVGTFSDLNPAGTVGDYQVGIDWGDGHTSVGTVSALGGSEFGVSGSHTYLTGGTYYVTFLVHSTRGREATGDATIHVSTDGQPLN